MAGRLRDTLSRRYRNRRRQHEQTRSDPRADRRFVRALLRAWRCDATRSRSVAVQFAYEISMQTTNHG